MLIRVFPPHYQLVYINFDISSFSMISYEPLVVGLQSTCSGSTKALVLGLQKKCSEATNRL